MIQPRRAIRYYSMTFLNKTCACPDFCHKYITTVDVHT